MVTLYTSIEEASEEISRRWLDLDLDKKIRDYLGGDLPPVFNERPHVILFRNIMTPNDECRRHLILAKKAGLDILGLEHTEDKFVSFNLDKYTLAMLFFYMGRRNDGGPHVYKKKIVDINSEQGKPFSSVRTLWNEDLVNFHHNLLYDCLPEYKGKIYNISDWLGRNGERSRVFYEKFMALLVRNCILVENFRFPGESVPHVRGRKDEGEFTENVIIPAFHKVESLFGLKPLIVQLAPDNYKTDPTWWYYRDSTEPVFESYIKNKKSQTNLV